MGCMDGTDSSAHLSIRRNYECLKVSYFMYDMTASIVLSVTIVSGHWWYIFTKNRMIFISRNFAELV